MRRSVFLLLALCLLPALALAGAPAGRFPGTAPGAAAGAAKQSARNLKPKPPRQASASARVELLEPERVNLGDPFVMRVRSARPLERLSVTWLERRASLSARKVPGGWEAVALLGTDVGNTAPGRHELVLRHGPKGRETVRRAVIEVLAVERPVERLELDEAFVSPPREEHARILAERRLMRKLLMGTLSRPVPEGRDTRLWSLPLLRPVPGEVSSPYGIGRVLNGQPHAPHRGLDLEAPEGESVLAAADGVVLFSGELYYAGKSVYLDHGQGLVTAYFHQSELRVRAGQKVARGQELGLAGSTGRSTRSHLHFGVWALGRNVDPEPLFLYDPLP